MKIVRVIMMFSSLLIGGAIKDSWDTFALVKFNPKFSKEANEYFLFPEFHPGIKALEGKSITLTGYYLPYDIPGRPW